MMSSSIIIPLMTTIMKRNEAPYLNLHMKRHNVTNSYTGTNVTCLTAKVNTLDLCPKLSKKSVTMTYHA